MAESALSTAVADALSGTTDSDTDAVYPTIGESTYYTTMYRMMQRMLQSFGAANELRVYKDGALTFGVRAGKFTAEDGTTTHSYAGATGQSVTDDDTTYIWLTVVSGAATLNTDYGGSAAFPDAGVTPHIPIATITAADGAYAYTDITDYRSRAMFRMLG